MKTLLTISISITLVITTLLAQTASPKYVGDRFEVVSIKPAQAEARSGRVLRVPLGSYCDGDVPQADPGRIALNNNLYTLITMAYGLNCLSRTWLTWYPEDRNGRKRIDGPFRR
jgi:hypothetical protein